MELVQMIKALGDETRIRILNLLMYNELCVCELEYLLGINQSNASRHLNKLNSTGIIFYEKKAQYVYYQIDKETLKKYPFIEKILNEELCKVKQCQIDIESLKKYKESGFTCEILKTDKN